MADQFPEFSLGIFLDPDVLCDLEKEHENELLASIDIEQAVSNSTNYRAMESKTSEQVTDENTEPGSSNILKTTKGLLTCQAPKLTKL